MRYFESRILAESLFWDHDKYPFHKWWSNRGNRLNLLRSKNKTNLFYYYFSIESMSIASRLSVSFDSSRSPIIFISPLISFCFFFSSFLTRTGNLKKRKVCGRGEEKRQEEHLRNWPFFGSTYTQLKAESNYSFIRHLEAHQSKIWINWRDRNNIYRVHHKFANRDRLLFGL